jgi:hypothetical protein
MMRFIALLVALFAAVAVTAAPAAAEAPDSFTYCVTVSDTDTGEVLYGPVTETWTVDDFGGNEAAYLGWIAYVTAVASESPVDFDGILVYVSLSGCEGDAPEVRLPDHAFVCGGGHNLDPGVLPLARAEAGFKDGTYRNPYAVAGVTPGRNNTQGKTGTQYTLTCDPQGKTPTGNYVDNNGYQIPEAYEKEHKRLIGVYEIVA